MDEITGEKAFNFYRDKATEAMKGTGEDLHFASFEEMPAAVRSAWKAIEEHLNLETTS